MLRNDLYQITAIEETGGVFVYRVALLPESAIYAAHFKGMPVTPGACLVQMAAELASEAAGHALEVEEASDIRFLHPVTPGEIACLDFRLMPDADDPVRWSVQVLSGETLCSRMKLSMRQ